MLHSLSLIIYVLKTLSSIPITIITTDFVTLLTIIYFIMKSVYIYCTLAFTDCSGHVHYTLVSRAVTIHSCHDPIRFDSDRSRSDRFDPIHYPFVQTNTTKISNSEYYLNDLLNKITMNNMTMNKITMNKHKYIIIHQPVTVII